MLENDDVQEKNKSRETDDDDDEDQNEAKIENFLRAGSSWIINQIDGNASVRSDSDIDEQTRACKDEDEQPHEDEYDDDSDESEYDTDDEVDSEPIRPVLIQSEDKPGELDVVFDERVQPPTSLPLCLCLNARSVYNKKNNLKNILNTLAPCITIISESWERKTLGLVELLDARHFSCVSFSRGRDDVTWDQPGPK